MKMVDVEIEEGLIFKVQENMSFMQRNKFTAILEKFLDLGKARELQEKYKDQDLEKLNPNDFIEALKEGKTISDLNLELSIYLLTNLVQEPKITMEMLEDPDDPNAENYYVLGMEMLKIGMQSIGTQTKLKKTLNI